MNRNVNLVVNVLSTTTSECADVNGDSVVSAIDALLFINALSQQKLAGKSEWSAISLDL